MIVANRFNNNVILACDGEKEYILMGKGIGFQVYPNDPVKMSVVEQTFVPSDSFAIQGIVNLAITAGSTPEEVYRYLVPEVKHKPYLAHAHYYNFDEIPYQNNDQEGITLRDLRHLFFTPADIPAENIHILDGENYQGQDQRIHEAGGLDAVLLGIGADGHYCGNLPGTTTINDATTKVECDARMKERIGRHFPNPADIPDYYVTMGPKSIMAAKQLILIANGKGKTSIMKKMIEEEIDLAWPATILKLHPNLTIIMDEEAASELEGR